MCNYRVKCGVCSESSPRHLGPGSGLGFCSLHSSSPLSTPRWPRLLHSRGSVALRTGGEGWGVLERLRWLYQVLAAWAAGHLCCSCSSRGWAGQREALFLLLVL